MKRLTVSTIVVALLAAVACGDDDSPTTPTQANSVTLTAALSAANENPPIQGTEASGTGNATVTFALTRDGSGNVTAATATFVVNISGLPPNTPINLSHIHVGAAGVNGAVVVNTGLTAAAPVTLTNGSGSFERGGISVDPALAQTIIGNPAGYYFNSHSTLNPGGVVRGQLVRVPQ
jgi:hypothetical protein